MSSRFAALLRGINVGKAKRVAMADLRSWLEDLGYSDVKTLLNSGNVVFSVEPKNESATAELATVVSKTIEERGGVSCAVIVLSQSEAHHIANENPFLEIAENPSNLLISIPMEPEDLATLAELDNQDWGEESFALGDRAAYSYSPKGVLEGQSLKALEKALKGAVTTRNWRTFEKLLRLL